MRRLYAALPAGSIVSGGGERLRLSTGASGSTAGTAGAPAWTSEAKAGCERMMVE
jgi:hypothetical protein